MTGKVTLRDGSRVSASVYQETIDQLLKLEREHFRSFQDLVNECRAVDICARKALHHIVCNVVEGEGLSLHFVDPLQRKEPPAPARLLTRRWSI